MTDFGGQVAVITGAARGIGFATAKRLSSAGAAVAILDRDEDAAKKAASSLSADGGNALFWRVDVTCEDEVVGCIADVTAKLGTPQILVNNAGMYPHVPFDQLDFKTWRDIVSANLDSTFLCCHAVFLLMRAAGYGRIINFASAVVLIGLQNVSAYAASKAGVIGLSRVLATEAGPHGITVNVVSPGLVASEGVMTSLARLFEHTIPTQAVKRRGEPEDIAHCIAYLASREASFITGQLVNVDGGARYH
ncbi:MAG TPA: SDR family NAD(P)-dependent oxidoreductase [Xanthobacteraceae bacterium]|nr:SDR family NAD(P)-dependent oxidoreductase [Xanthobacteraceae bacterium]